MFGGSADLWGGSAEKQSKLADTTLLQFCEYINIFLHDSTCMCNATVFRELVMLIIIIVIMSQVMFLVYCHAV